MTQLLPVQPQRTFLLEVIAELARAAVEQESTGANSLLEDCLLSLVLIEMKQIVRFHSRAGYRNQGTLLNQALDSVEQALDRKLAFGGEVSTKKFWKPVRDALKQPSLRLEELQANLMEANRRKRLPENQQVTEGTEVPFEILVLKEFETEGLVAVPTEDGRYYLDLDRVKAQENWMVMGDYYPFEVIAAEFSFVISDAGEILLYTRNFPESLIQQARQVLIFLAKCLYTTRRPDFFKPAPQFLVEDLSPDETSFDQGL